MRTTDPDFLHYLKTGSMNLVGNFDIPKVKGVKFKDLSKVDLIGFNYCTNPKMMEQRGKAFVHFFLPDHYIERVWNNPDYYEVIFNQYKGIVQPDFSLYTDMPKAMQIWQHYRRMWLGSYYQSRGVLVIPAPCWSNEGSFEYCFDGMPKGSCLCISSVGCVKNPQVRILFNEGLKETIDRLEPSQLIIYGVIDDNMRERIRGIPYKHIDGEMKQRIQKFEASQK